MRKFKAVCLSFYWFNDSWIWTRNSWIQTRNSWIGTCNSWIWTRNSWIRTCNSWIGTRSFEFQLALLSFQLVPLCFQLVTGNSQLVTRNSYFRFSRSWTNLFVLVLSCILPSFLSLILVSCLWYLKNISFSINLFLSNFLICKFSSIISLIKLKLIVQIIVFLFLLFFLIKYLQCFSIKLSIFSEI